MGGEFFSSVAKKTKKLRLRRHRKKSTEYGDGNLTEEEFEIVRSSLEKNRRVAATSFANAYQVDRESPQVTTDGTLVTTLTGDIWYVVEIHLKVLDDLLMLPHQQEKGPDGKLKKKKDRKARHPFPFSKDQHEAIALEGITAIFRPLLFEQTRYCRTKLFPEDTSQKAGTSLEVYCAAANDFMALANQTEELVQRLEKKYPFLTLSGEPLKDHSDADSSSDDSEEFDEEAKVEVDEDDDVAMLLPSALIHAFTRDAVMAAQHVHVGCMQRAILYNPTAQKLFGFDWEDRFAANEVCADLLNNLKEILNQVQAYFSTTYLFEKFLQALCRAVVAAYLQRLARKANNPANIFLPPRNQHQNDLFISLPDDDEYDDEYIQDQLRNQPPLQGDELPYLSVLKYAMQSPKQRQGLPKNHRYNRFVSTSVAMGRIRRDIKVLEDFFLEFTQDRPATPFARGLKEELGLLKTVYDYLNLVKGYERRNNDLMVELIVKFHKQSQMEYHLTRYFMTDLFHLMKPALVRRKKLTKLWTKMEPQLQMMSYKTQLEAASEAQVKLDTIVLQRSSSVEAENDILGLSMSSSTSSAKSTSSECSTFWEGPPTLSTPTMLADYYEEKMHHQVICADPVQGCWDRVVQQQNKEETVIGCNPLKLWMG